MHSYTLYSRRARSAYAVHAKLLAVAVVAYALSPFDLIADFIPAIGYLDDLIIVPLGITAVLQLVPPTSSPTVVSRRRCAWCGA